MDWIGLANDSSECHPAAKKDKSDEEEEEKEEERRKKKEKRRRQREEKKKGGGGEMTRDRNIIAAPLYIPAGRVEKSTEIHHENLTNVFLPTSKSKFKFKSNNKY